MKLDVTYVIIPQPKLKEKNDTHNVLYNR